MELPSQSRFTNRVHASHHIHLNHPVHKMTTKPFFVFAKFLALSRFRQKNRRTQKFSTTKLLPHNTNTKNMINNQWLLSSPYPNLRTCLFFVFSHPHCLFRPQNPRRLLQTTAFCGPPVVVPAGVPPFLFLKFSVLPPLRPHSLQRDPKVSQCRALAFFRKLFASVLASVKFLRHAVQRDRQLFEFPGHFGTNNSLKIVAGLPHAMRDNVEQPWEEREEHVPSCVAKLFFSDQIVHERPHADHRSHDAERGGGLLLLGGEAGGGPAVLVQRRG